MNNELFQVIENAEKGMPMTVAEMTAIFDSRDEAIVSALFAAADRVRSRAVGDAVYFRALVEFSNFCRNRCAYCGINASKRTIRRYRMQPAEIIEAVAVAHRSGIGTAVLQSGEDPWYDTDKLCCVIREIKSRFGMAVTLSLGEREYEEYRLLREAGADRYLLRHETSDPDLYGALHPGLSFEHRLQCLRWLKELGYQTGSGNMVGLPGQSTASLAGDVALVRDMKLEMVGVGPFIPSAGTLLADSPAGSLDTVFREIALLRINSPYLMIPATSAVATIDHMGREQALQCGANVLMPNFTPMQYREAYQLYPGKACLNESSDECIGCMSRRVASVGRTVGRGPGHSPLLQSAC